MENKKKQGDKRTHYKGNILQSVRNHSDLGNLVMLKECKERNETPTMGGIRKIRLPRKIWRDEVTEDKYIGNKEMEGCVRDGQEWTKIHKEL
jgi:hypothetical protein